ncbi:TonB-dependent receptor [Sphingomonas bacterium]|uniref:TonB-dependent receptor n=1 Tax=Sphingomonas bacterium TaxID=1895847 RepID=UPI00345BD75B
MALRVSLTLALIAAAACHSAPAFARDAVISIPATTLDVALIELARETGVEIMSTEPGLRSVRTRPIQGHMSVRTALGQLLQRTGYRARANAGGYRIVRVIAKSAARSRPVASPNPPPGPDIVITASKQRIPLLRYPGSLTVVGPLPVRPWQAAENMSDMAETLPILQGTQLGAGRNKIFIRGVADSSFNGSTQSTTSLYLDDVQINYSGPDPGLRLYDVRSIEILEGPQGTLYGAGSIGGVIRVSSNPVDLSKIAGSFAGGVTLTSGGATGFDTAGMVNLPIAKERFGLRAVGYNIRDGGYIDDAGRGSRLVNSSDTVGARLALRLDPGGGWRVEASGTGQRIDTRDAQYAETVEGPLTRRSRIAQPFDSDLLFGRVVVSKTWGSGLRFFSASGIVGYRSTDRFDATPRAGAGGAPTMPTIYTANRSKRLLSQEARLSRSMSGGNSWVFGFTLISDRDILTRSLGSPGNDLDIIGVTNVTKAASAFGEATVGLSPRLSITGGARVTLARTDGDPSSAPRSTNFVKGRSTRRLDPTLALSWQLAPQLALFARFQTGYRTGGLAVAPGVGRVADYQPDEIRVGELGFRKLRAGPTGLAVSSSVSLARWSNIQADLINRRGLPYTANIGDAKIETIEGNVDWIPVVGFRVVGSFLLTDNTVSGPIADLSKRDNRRLPETPPFAGHGGVSYQWRTGQVEPQIGLTTDYVGRSVLGTGDLLDVSQGNYWVVGLSANLRWKGIDFSFLGNNLTNSTANRFAFGNPFSLSYRDQATPLRPRNLRLAVGVAW